MYTKTIIVAAFGALFASVASASALPNAEAQVAARSVLIATTPYYACNCPNNCSYKKGHSCKFFKGPSDNSKVVSGKCELRSGALECIAN